MKVVISGAFSTGKTTLYNNLEELGFFDSYISDLPRTFLQEFPHVDWTHPATRYFNLLYQCLRESQEESKFENVLCDGGIYECIGHTHALSEVTFDNSLLSYHPKEYDLAILCSPYEVPIEDDGLRYTNCDLRELVHQEIQKSLIGSNVNFVVAEGDENERFEFAKKHIFQYYHQLMSEILD